MSIEILKPRLPNLSSLWTDHPNSLLATDNPASPAEAGHLDTRCKIPSLAGPSILHLRNVAQRTRVRVQIKKVLHRNRRKIQILFDELGEDAGEFLGIMTETVELRSDRENIRS